MTPRRGSVWSTSATATVLVVSSTIYNEITSEPTVLAMPVVEHEPDTGFGVDVGAGWVVPSLIFPLRKTSLIEHRHTATTQQLTTVNNMLFKVLATPE